MPGREKLNGCAQFTSVPRYSAHRKTLWERACSRRRRASRLIVPTLCVGMQPGTLRVPSRAERGASVEAFPRRAWERSCSGRWIEVIQHPIHRQFAEHDQLRNSQQRPALRRGQQVGDVLGDGFGRGECFAGIGQQFFGFGVGGSASSAWRWRGAGWKEVVVEVATVCRLANR